MNELMRRRRALMAAGGGGGGGATLSSLTAGTELQIKESGSYVPYVFLGLDANGNARALRRDVLARRRVNNENTGDYAGTEIDTWLENAESGYLSVFDAATLSALVPTMISYREYSAPGAAATYPTIQRRAFLPSVKELGGGGAETDNNYLGSLMTYYNTETTNDARIADAQYWTRTAWTNASAVQMQLILSTGALYRAYAINTATAPRPELSINASTSVTITDGVAYL